ncbi:hypothetical protein, partial [Mesorhizobium sp.]|uniref:hypothetical protein n=1 Tax=Mesorhizobium sp. TaxID=1871066 RepID=UPI00257BE46B
MGIEKARAQPGASASLLALAGLVFASRITHGFAIPQNRAICRVEEIPTSSMNGPPTPSAA